MGRSTVALAVCRHLGREPVRVDGSNIGGASFVGGPLLQAMREGRLLFVKNLNRLPESAQSTLLAALDEHLIRVADTGDVRAADGFQVVATQDPGKSEVEGRLAEALRDRFERLALPYQSAAEEAAIVAADSGSDDVALVTLAVRVTRGTRLHPCFRRGAPVRGASDMVTITEDLWAENRDACGAVSRETLRRAAEAALAPLVELSGDCDADLGTALDALLELVCGRGLDPDVALAKATT